MQISLIVVYLGVKFSMRKNHFFSGISKGFKFQNYFSVDGVQNIYSIRRTFSLLNFQLVLQLYEKYKFSFTNFFPYICIGFGFSSLLYADYQYKRERPIIFSHDNLPLNTNLIWSDSEFIVVAKKPKGDLSGAILKHKKTGNLYVMKGAQSFNHLKKEYDIANFLADLFPNVQPESLIMQKKLEDGNVQLYSLSRKFDHTMDLECFLRQPNWEKKLAQKPMLGFEVALAIDFMLAKQQDMKLANYVVIEKKDHFRVVSIDHEYANQGHLAQTILSFPTQEFLETLLQSINDFRPQDEMNNAGLAGDPRVKTFFNHIYPTLDPEKIIDLYYAVSNFRNPKFLSNPYVSHLQKKAEELVSSFQLQATKMETEPTLKLISSRVGYK